MTETFYFLQVILSLCQRAQQSLDIELEFSQHCESLILYNYTQFKTVEKCPTSPTKWFSCKRHILQICIPPLGKKPEIRECQLFFYCSVLKIVLSQQCVHRKHPEWEAEHCVYSNWTRVYIAFQEDESIDAPVTFLWLWFIYLLAYLFIRLFDKWWVDLTEASNRMIPQVLMIWTFGWRSNITQFLYFNFCYVFGQRI